MNIDAHAHLSFLTATQVQSLCSKTSLRWLLGGYDADDWQKQEVLRASFPDRFWLSFGIHPWVIADRGLHELETQWEVLQKQALNADFLGEMGLDFKVARSVEAQARQRYWFERQLQLAGELKKKIVLHVVQAHAAAFEALDATQFSQTRCDNSCGFVHGFSGSFEIAEQYRHRGFLISIGPQVLKDHFKKLKEALIKIPLENLIVESDSPSDPEDPNYAGEQVLSQVALEIAKIKGLPPSEVIQAVEGNLRHLIGVKP